MWSNSLAALHVSGESLMSTPVLAKNKNTEVGPTHKGTDVGATLTAARLKKDLTIKDIAAELCIRASYLEAMEANRIKGLPDGIFAIGFFRNYADHLGLDSEALVTEYRRFLGLAAPVGRNIKQPDSRSAHSEYAANMIAARKPKPSGIWQVLTGVAGVLAVWITFAGDNEAFDGNRVEPRTVILADGSLPVTANQLAATNSPVAQFSEVNASRPLTEAGTNRAKVPFRSISMFPSLTASDKVPDTGVSVRAVEDTWVSFAKVDGTLIWEGILPAGESYHPGAQQHFLLTSSNAGALRLVRAGQDELLGGKGVMLVSKSVGNVPDAPAMKTTSRTTSEDIFDTVLSADSSDN